MKKRLFSISILATVLVSVSAFVKISSGGIIGVSGAPGESNCSACHGASTGLTIVGINATPAFVANQYVPGQTYTLDITITNTSFTKFGFDCEILTLANANAGTMTTAFAGVQFANSGTRKNATQTTPKTGSGSVIFSFVWVAPLSGTAKIYVAGNAVNGNGSTSGDVPGNNVFALTANTSVSGINDPVISSANFNLYPNPVISDFRMQYTLIHDGNVKATLYNLHGQEVNVLLSENQTVGVHSVSAVLPSDLQAGIYMVKLSVNSMPYAQRMLVKQ